MKFLFEIVWLLLSTAIWVTPAKAVFTGATDIPTEMPAPGMTTQPAEATPATQPTQPTQPTLPAEATPATQPTQPTEATQPTPATQPTLPTEATQPTPEAATQPTEATQQTEPTQPTTTTKTTKAPDANDTKDKEINIKIEHILATSKTGNYEGNVEYEQHATILRLAGNLDSSLANLKQHAYEKFVSFNSLRLKLEGEVNSQLAVTQSHLQNPKLSEECRVFYKKQERELKKALTESNALKSYKLQIFSDTCPYKDTDSESDSDSDEDYYFWPFFNSRPSLLEE